MINSPNAHRRTVSLVPCLLLLAIVSLCACHSTSGNERLCDGPGSGGTLFDTKGIPLRGVLTDHGTPVAETLFFGEGTTEIRFYGNQRLQTCDAHGRPIAGFEVRPLHPPAKMTLAYVYSWDDPWWKSSGKQRGISLRQGVSGVTYRKGIFEVQNPDEKVLTGYKTGGKEISVLFGSTSTAAGGASGTINLLTLKSETGREFRFRVHPTSSLTYIHDGGDFGRFLTSLGPQDDTTDDPNAWVK